MFVLRTLWRGPISWGPRRFVGRPQAKWYIFSMSAASEYISEVAKLHASGDSTEYTYRTAFETYLATVFMKEEGYSVRHERSTGDSNKPDFIVLKGDVPVLYIEVKKPGEDLDKIEKSNQAKRYFGYTNLVISDYIEFRFYRNGKRYSEEPIHLATFNKTHSHIIPCHGQEQYLRDTLRDFITTQKEPISSGRHLAEIMGGKARRIRANVVAFLESESDKKDELERMRCFIKQHLIAEFSTDDFADMYAQTLVYGLFAARYNDDKLETFSRQEARDLIPATNPFLKSFFDHISGSTFPRRLELIVDELCEVFTHADVKTLMEEYFKQTNLFGEEHDAPDPVIHFYEDFLHEYDSTKKMEMGVFYTPLPVVRFIVRGIDGLLKREFSIHDGLADTETIEQTIMRADDTGKRKSDKQTVPRVQLLDVAVGTGTFLNETIKHIHAAKSANVGRWPSYVNEQLLPRLHGFELMMASYTIAHLKLAMTLKQTGADSFTHRLGVYLSNTLDYPHNVPLTDSLFGAAASIAEESKRASAVKNEKPIMVVMGNPPYSGISQNRHYTENEKYKVEPGGQQKLQERKHWLDDDYVKFIRFAESMVEKNKEGIIGMITAHGYLDNPTFRGMRWHLRNTFDTIYVLDLHGNSNKKETAPDGSEDKNVFDIKTGVSIIFGVKKRREGKSKKSLATVYRADLYGKRAAKFAALNDAKTLQAVEWIELPAESEGWYLEGEGKAAYQKGFSVAELFPKNTTGIVTARDSVVIDMDREALLQRIQTFTNSDMGESELREFLFPGKKDGKYKAGDTRGWKLMEARRKIQDLEHTEQIKPIAYRPFDTRFCYYHPDMVDWGRFELMSNLYRGENINFVAMRQATDDSNYNHVVLTSDVVDNRFMYSGKGITIQMPLYLYENNERIANLDSEIVRAIESVVGTTTHEDVLDYVYAVLHSPSYRTKYEEFLKSDFPRVPYPGEKSGVSKEIFWELVAQGRHLRELHFLTHPAVRESITAFPESGSDVVEKPVFKDGRVYINPEQYWDGVPEAVWNFYVGGYQPAQKYLKDRKSRTLTSAEFENYERMLVSLNETMKVMTQIDTVWQPE